MIKGIDLKKFVEDAHKITKDRVPGLTLSEFKNNLRKKLVSGWSQTGHHGDVEVKHWRTYALELEDQIYALLNEKENG